jgi:CRP/FNR family transcriptional regulator, cyclic AMP receptor protein
MLNTYDLLAAHPFLAGLAPPHLDRLSHFATRAPLHPDTRVFSEGGRANGFWLLRDGYVNIDMQVPGRGTVIVDTLGPGSVLGWSWLFPPYRWHFGAVTDGPVLTLAVSGADIRAACEVNPSFGYEISQRFLRVVVERMQATRMRLIDLDGAAT